MKPPDQERRAAALRLGAGAGFAGDRTDPAIELARKGPRMRWHSLAPV